MSQVLDLPLSPVSRTVGLRPSEEFSYQPMPVLAVTSLILAVLSLLGILIWVVLPIAALAILLGVIALIKIVASKGEYGGGLVASAGILVAVAALVAGITYQMHLFNNEVPTGFERFSFKDDIAAQDITFDNNHKVIVDADIEKIVGKQIFTKGFVYPGEEKFGLKHVLLCLDSGTCCFGGKPKPTDMIGVTMSPENRVVYMAGKVSVAGKFQVNPEYTGQSELVPLYEIKDCGFYTQAHSDF